MGIIRSYTREAGVRNLEREIASICRKVAREAIRHPEKKQFTVNAGAIAKYLGPPQFKHSQIEDKDQIGIVTGLAWTPVGGELLCVEALIMPGKGDLIITGKLGDVMKESAQAAVSYVRSRADQLKLDKDFYKKLDIHIHIPEGAIPKDGPSAGISMSTAITSALTRQPVRHDVAMTGEITLRGRVLPIGGLKEKALAAHRGGIKKVIIPKENEKDLRDIPASITKQIEIVPVEHMDEVLLHALVVEPGQPMFQHSDIPMDISGKETPSDAPLI
jgi:ATP-dependent Lon protease